MKGRPFLRGIPCRGLAHLTEDERSKAQLALEDLRVRGIRRSG